MGASGAVLALTIVALGDSTTAGTPYFRSPIEAPPDGSGDAEAPYAYHMMELRPGWRVVNRGVNGERTDEILARLERDVIRVKPRYALILAGVNDVYQGVPQKAIRQNLRALWRRTKTAGIVPVAASVLPFTKATAGQSRAIRWLNAWIKKAAAEEGIAFCDAHAAAADPADPDKLRGTDDGLHPDIPTYRRVGEAFVPVIDGLEVGFTQD